MNLIKKIFFPFTSTIKFIQENFKATLFITLMVVLFFPQKNATTPYNLQEILLLGPIMDATQIVEKIDKAAQDENIKGVLLTVNSPGGAVAPSIEIAYAIKRLQKLKPVVVYAQGTIASGSYYASIWADTIIANPGSMVGSIGVVMQGYDLSEIMQKVGVKTQVVQAGKFKLIGTPSRVWRDYERAELNKIIQDTYVTFTLDVAQARDLNISQKDDFANAHIFTAMQAKKVGLIDTLGVKYDAKKELEKRTKVTKPNWHTMDKYDKMLKKLMATTAINLYTYFPQMILK